jgi:hypothetical protein
MTANLEDQRQAAADAAFEAYDFGDAIGETSGWERDSGEPDVIRRSVFLDDNDGPSIRVRFAVRFEPGTALVVDADHY